jgi:hypothetical protein
MQSGKGNHYKIGTKYSTGNNIKSCAIYKIGPQNRGYYQYIHEYEYIGKIDPMKPEISVSKIKTAVGNKNYDRKRLNQKSGR